MKPESWARYEGEKRPVIPGVYPSAAGSEGTGPWDICSSLTPSLKHIHYCLLVLMYLYELTYIIEQTQTMKTSRAGVKGLSG